MVQTLLPQREHAIVRVTGEEQFQHLIEEPRRRNVRKERHERQDRLTRSRIDFEAAARRESHGAQHANRIFAITLKGVADHAQASPFQIRDAVVVIPDLLRLRIIEERVHREVATGCVLFLRPEHVVA